MLKVVIVGGGFGGLAAARRLKRHKNIRITLLSDRHGFRYAPALYRTATGFAMRSSAIPLKEITADIPNLRLVYGRASRIDPGKRTLITSTGERIHYDYVIFALGSVPNYFDIPGIEKEAYKINTAQEILKLRKHLHDRIAYRATEDKNYIVVGAGATGVEVAAGLASYIKSISKRHKVKRPGVKIELLDAANRPLPNLSKAVSRKVRRRLKRLKVHFRPNSKVEYSAPGQLVTNKRTFDTNTIIWTAGFKNNPFYARQKGVFGFDNRGRILTDDYMRAQDRIFVIGDSAATRYSGYAQTAVHDGHYVARQLKRLIRKKKLKKYHLRRPFSVVPVGKRWAAVEYGPFKIAGRIGFVFRDLADFIGYNDVMPVSIALKIWHGRNNTEEYCPVCKNP